jgi:phosphatidylinositol glycan class A protein
MICREFTNVNFIIGGDGPKRILLEKMVDSFGLHNRVELLG